MSPRPPLSTLFPYTTLFRSLITLADADDHVVQQRAGQAMKGLALALVVGTGDDQFFLGVVELDRDEGVNLQLEDRKSTRLNSSHQIISYAVFCLKKKKKKIA